VSITDLAVSLGAKSEAQFQSEFKNDLLRGVVVLRHTGVAYDRTASRNALTPDTAAIGCRADGCG
jgi:hypothetical protein